MAFWPRAGTGWALTPLADAQGEGSARDLESRRSREREREGFEGQTSRISGAEKPLEGREACLGLPWGSAVSVRASASECHSIRMSECQCVRVSERQHQSVNVRASAPASQRQSARVSERQSVRAPGRQSQHVVTLAHVLILSTKCIAHVLILSTKYIAIDFSSIHASTAGREGHMQAGATSPATHFLAMATCRGFVLQCTADLVRPARPGRC